MKILKIGLYLLLLTFYSISSFASPFPYNKIVFFGDSLTDNGNLYNTFFKYIPKSPPYFEGQFSNGPVWAEDLKDYFPNVILDNYAVGGETAVWHNPFGGFLPYRLSQSINNYLSSESEEDKTKTLFFMWIGGNDYLQGGEPVEDATNSVVQTIQESLEKLIKVGAKHFIVMNLPNLARVPEGRDGGKADNIFDLTVKHNAKLAIAMTQLQLHHPDITIRLFDTFTIMNQMLDDPAAMNHKYHTHVKNTYDMCWHGGYSIQQKHLEAALKQKFGSEKINSRVMSESILLSPDLAAAYSVGESYSRGATPCDDPDTYVFWDKVHPTAVIHKVMAAEMQRFMRQ